MRKLWIPAALIVAVCVAAVPAMANFHPPPPPPTHVNYTDGVASGDVTQSRAVLWTRVDAATKVTVEVYNNPAMNWWQLRSWGRQTTDASRDFTVKIDVGFLRPNTQYWYRFKSAAGDISQTGTFKTAPRSNDEGCWFWWFFHCHKGSQNKDVHFGYTGDFDVTRIPSDPSHSGAPSHPGNPPEGTGGAGKVLDALRAENPDFWVFLGDTVYQDSSFRNPPANPTGPGPAMTLAQYRETYREQRSYQPVRDIFAATSAYVQWDDHEVYNDFTAETVDPTRFANGRQAYLENHPVREKFPHDTSCAGDPMYRKQGWGDAADLFILDERSCRSHEATAACFGDLAPTLPQSARQTFPFSLFLTPTPPAGCLDEINDPSRTLLGPVQKAKFKQDLLRSDAQYKFVINDDPIMQQYVLPYDRWEGYAAERNEILDFIRDNGITNVVFLTTDQHATVQGDVYKDFFSDPAKIADEMVTGPIGTETYQQEVIATAGPVGLFAVNAAYTAFTRVECKNFDRYSYAKVDVTAGSTTTNTSKDDTGAPVLNTNAPPVPPTCIDTYGP
jgi:alkaline phosphatase D